MTSHFNRNYNEETGTGSLLAVQFYLLARMMREMMLPRRPRQDTVQDRAPAIHHLNINKGLSV